MISWVQKEGHKRFAIQDFFIIKDIFLKSHVRKTIQFSEAEVAANFDITPTSIDVQRFTGDAYDWSILNDWPI